jgi:hypothetical protein
MKTALVLSGQLRTFQHPAVLTSLRTFIEQFVECDVFLSVWDKIGFSYKHGDGVRPENADNSVKAEPIISLIPRLKGLHIESEEEWRSKISEPYKAIYTEGFEWCNMKITGTVVPQLYKIWDGNRLKQEYEKANNFTYDLVIRSRPDNQYFSDIKHQYLTDLTKIYAINCAGTYFPNRIYDIFFFSNSANMDILCDAYNHILRNESHPFSNGLHPRDPCRILRVQALISEIPVVDMDSNVCMIYRSTV